MYASAANIVVSRCQTYHFLGKYIIVHDTFPITLLLSALFYSRFPKSNELLKKWLHAIGVEKKITASSRICSRHFKEDDFRYSLVGGKRFLKHEAIPSLYLNEEWEDEQGNAVADNQNTIVQENQPTNTVISYNIIGSENETLDIVESHIETKRDDELSER